MFLPLQTDKLTGNYNVNDHHSGGGSTGILKSQSKGTQFSPEKSGITFPALKFSFIFKVTEKFRRCHINMQKYILVSNTGRISHSFFCDPMGLLLHSIVSLYYKPSFNILSALQSLSSLKAGNSCFVLWSLFLLSGWIQKKGKRKEGMMGRREGMMGRREGMVLVVG